MMKQTPTLSDLQRPQAARVTRVALLSFVLASGAFAADAQDRGTQSAQSVMNMANRVERSILALPQYSLFDEIRFTIKDYVVTLKGSATRPILKSAAESEVRKIEGVTDVVNEIEVLPISRQDEDIRFRTYVAIYGDLWLSRYNPNRGSPVFFSPGARAMGISQDPPPGFHPIHIIVQNGRVRLTGVVDNAGDKVMAGMRANNIPDVFAVENELAIAQEAKPIKSKKPAKKS